MRRRGHGKIVRITMRFVPPDSVQMVAYSRRERFEFSPVEFNEDFDETLKKAVEDFDLTHGAMSDFVHEVALFSAAFVLEREMLETQWQIQLFCIPVVLEKDECFFLKTPVFPTPLLCFLGGENSHKTSRDHVYARPSIH